MKKILVFLLILAVAGGVFAQEGSWSVGGKGEIGTFFDFAANDGKYYQPNYVGTAFHTFHEWWDGINGVFNVNYNNGGLGAGLEFVSENAYAGDGQSQIMGNLSYNGDNFNFQYKTNVFNFQDDNTFDATVDRLWGSYTLMDGQIYIEAAYNSPDKAQWGWGSDGTAGIDNWTDFTKVDHGNYLVFAFSPQIDGVGLTIGYILPRVFQGGGYTWGGFGGWSQGAAAHSPEGLLKDIFGDSIFAVKLGMDAFEVAIQLALNGAAIFSGNTGDPADGSSDDNNAVYGRTGIYAGLRVHGLPVSLGASFMGYFPNDDDPDDLNFRGRVGASVGFGEGPLGVGLGLMFNMWAETFHITPNVSYQIVPDYLGAKAEIELTLGEEHFDWKFVTNVFFNIKGTGAATGYWWPMDTGLIFRYALRGNPDVEYASDSLADGITLHMLGLYFRWTF